MSTPFPESAFTRRSLFGAVAGSAIARGQRARRTNLLFLIADDHRYDVIGPETARNLDRLASEATSFTRHYVNYPMCTPSRQSVLTGLLPHASGVSLLRTPLAEDRRTLAGQLKAAGYRTAAIGKMHFQRKPYAGMHGFDVALVEGAVEAAWREEVKPRPAPAGVAVKPQWRPFRDPARIWLNADKLPYPRYDDEMLGTYIARRAAQYLEENRQHPFALWVSFKEPHSPFDFPIEDRNHFDPSKFSVPKVGPEDAWQIPLIFRELSDEDKRGIIAAYHTSVRFMDRNVGRVLDALKRLRLDENTLVLYWGDNGYMLGEHGRFEKHCFYEPAIRVPLLARFPGRIPSGAKVEALTESADIAPTILDFLDVDPLPAMHGRSLAPYLRGEEPANPRQHVFSEYLHNEEACVRTERWKFIYCTGKRKRDDGYATGNPTPGRYWRLYDLKFDPGEFTDAAKQQPEVVASMIDLLLKRFRETHPEADQEPGQAAKEEILDWYLRPRDA